MIKGQVPEFSHEDVQLSWYIGSVKQTEAFPTKDDGYIGTSVSCEHGATAEWSNIYWGLTNIKSNNYKKIYCSVTFEETSEKNLSYVANVGDLVSYTPPSAPEGGNNIPASWTGCPGNNTKCSSQSDQTIHPEYNKLWRVIRKNTDGTVDIISEYTSYEEIYFYGLEGYQLFVESLNNIAKLYKNETYIQGARSIGYNGQTGSLSNTALVMVNYNTPIWPIGTINNDNEIEGGGDILYQIDTGTNVIDGVDYGGENGIIYQVYKKYRESELHPLLAYRTNTDGTQGESITYWLASRNYSKNSEIWRYNGNEITANGYITSQRFSDSNEGFRSNCAKIRPILTVKSGLTVTGNGNDIPWKIN